MILEELISIYEAQDKHSEAEPFVREQLEIIDQVLGSDSTRMGSSLVRHAMYLPTGLERDKEFDRGFAIMQHELLQRRGGRCMFMIFGIIL